MLRATSAPYACIVDALCDRAYLYGLSRNMQAAMADLEFVLSHRDEVEVEVAISVAFDVAQFNLRRGDRKKAQDAARISVDLASEYNAKGIGRLGDQAQGLANKAAALLQSIGGT